MKIYKVEQVESMGFSDDIGYYSNLGSALKRMKLAIRELRETDSWAEKGDLPTGVERNGEIKRFKKDSEDPFMKRDYERGYRYSAIGYYWYKCSYEYDEWDVTSRDFRIMEIEIDKPFN